jgi:crotonobetainyl-CoA:carnitine CoA-transferase CaiB-like acyl-CoA transferase
LTSANGARPAGEGYLHGVRVLEVANELGEYCGKVLAGLGADVIKVEPLGGEITRTYGPFYHDVEDRDGSLYFWHYNFGKRGVELDLDTAEGQEAFRSLAADAHVVIDTRPRGFMAERGIGSEELRALNPSLIYARISPFGDDGPWAEYQASDLIHLALGGIAMNCGYDPDPFNRYETPPIAPQMWQSYHIAGEMTVISILAALDYRLRTGKGQVLSTSVHEAVAKNTETDIPDWIYLGQTHFRLTCRHSTANVSTPALSLTKDGRYLLPYRTYLTGSAATWETGVKLLLKYGWEGDLLDPKYSDISYRDSREAQRYMSMQIDTLVGRLMFDADLWREAQSLGLAWAPIRRPEENLDDEHWRARDAFFEVKHPELDETFRYVGAKWLCREVPWRRGPRAPRLGEHTDEVLAEWTASKPDQQVAHRSSRATEPVISKRGKPFALSHIRVVDLSWMLASAGAGRYLAAMGAEVIKVEHESRWDWMRFGLGLCPPGGRPEREAAKSPLPTPKPDGPNRSGSFMEINSGKLGMSLNLKSPEGKAILESLIRDADVVTEGFAPGVMQRMGFGYERLKELNPSIIYVQQSGFGEEGTYGQMKAYGPTAAGFSGISEMSGLPEPMPPAGIGYSYLDWFGAYNMANAILAAIYRRDTTGKGCYIDASQGETGLYLLGSSILDASVNGRRWTRYGNRSPYKQAAPHGIYRAKGADRWIAIAAFTDDQWRSVASVLGHPAWTELERFATLEMRLMNQDELDTLVNDETQAWERFALMEALQAAGVPTGVCQTAEDRVETDPQLAHLDWMVELDQSSVGRWPVKEHPVKMSETPPYIGGRFNKSGPTYGEDTEYVLKTYLGFDNARIAEARSSGSL